MSLDGQRWRCASNKPGATSQLQVSKNCGGTSYAASNSDPQPLHVAAAHAWACPHLCFVVWSAPQQVFAVYLQGAGVLAVETSREIHSAVPSIADLFQLEALLVILPSQWLNASCGHVPGPPALPRQRTYVPLLEVS